MKNVMFIIFWISIIIIVKTLINSMLCKRLLYIIYLERRTRNSSQNKTQDKLCTTSEELTAGM